MRITSVNLHLGMYGDELCFFVPCFIPFSLLQMLPPGLTSGVSASILEIYPFTSTATKLILVSVTS